MYGTNKFLRKLAYMDMRRHALGIKAAIAEDAALQSSKLQDVIINLSYTTRPPVISLMSFEEFYKISSEHSRPGVMRLHSSLRSGDLLLRACSTGAGHWEQDGEVFIEPTALLDDLSDLRENGVDFSERYGEHAPTWARPPFQTSEGAVLEFELDEIDALLVDANCRYSTSDSDADSKPKTIFDYVEETVRANTRR